ncbi:ATP-dependent Clp protease proteolytic subunit 3 [Carex littledalei]|uniref:ATP-dependent Clp protease proteolytic subunit n=1 Tax=Carex littledalei TaxID=544730 RepID=A0A833RW92_9POAL|nr:ATP-dependent Clp protease proteolytic subunit 3 [Carex littledalei]
MEAMATTQLFSPLPSSRDFSNRTLLRSAQRVSVKAMAKGEGVSRIRRRTLSSNWDLFRTPSSSLSHDQFDTNEMLLKQRIVFLGSQVEPVTADLIVSQLLLLDANDPTKEIKLFINSPGGSITDGMAIYDGMKLCRADISTFCMGLAANVAAFILACGTRGKRFCMPNSRVMIQKPFGVRSNQGVRIRETMYETLKMMKIYSIITGKPQDQIELDTDHENFMDPWQAKDYGLVDAVIDDGKPGLVAPAPAPTGPPQINEWALRNLPSLVKPTLAPIGPPETSDLGLQT